MLTLNQLKKKSSKYGILVGKILLVFLLIFVLFKGGLALKEVFFPSPPPAPEMAFGTLPKINFPTNTNLNNITYNIDTLTGDLPSFPNLIKVYEMTPYIASLLDVENTQRTVNSAGFQGQGLKIADNLYQWSKDGANLTVNALTKDYALDIKIDNNEGNIKNQDEAILSANSFMNSMFAPLDLDQSKTSVILFMLSGSSLVRAESLSGSNIIAVNYYQKDIDDYPIMYPDGDESTMVIYVDRSDQIAGANFFHQTVGDQSSTYPVISAQEAFRELKDGKAYIALNNVKSNRVNIKKIYLGYYMGKEKQSYLMPVVVFESEGFLAYVPAIKAESLSK